MWKRDSIRIILGIRNSVWGWLPNQGPWPRSRALTSHAAVESRALRGSLSCVAKKRSTTAEGWSSNQRRPPGRPAVHASHGRCASRSGISGRHIHVPSGNVAHPARRPSGIRPTCLPGLNGVGGQDQVLLLTVQSHTTFRIPNKKRSCRKHRFLNRKGALGVETARRLPEISSHHHSCLRP